MEAKRVPIKTSRLLHQVMSGYYGAAKEAEGTGTKIAWVTSGAPVEILYAAGVIPIYPENHAALCGAQRAAVKLCEVAETEEGFSRDLCSYVRADVGAILSGKSPIGGLPKPDFLVCCNNICGTVTKWYQYLERHFGVPLIFVDTPFQHGAADPAAIDYVHAQLADMRSAVGQITGAPVTEDQLRATLDLSGQAATLWGATLDLLAAKPAPMTSFDTFVHMAPIVVMRGTQRCIDYYEALHAEIAERVEQGIAAVPGERFRLGWDNIPIWFAVRALSRKFAGHGACMVAATYASAWAQAFNLDGGTDPLRAMAETYTSIYLNVGMEERVKTLVDMVEKYSLDGLVMHSDRSCRAYSLGQYDLARMLKERINLPVLIIEADMADNRTYAEEAIYTRIEAFMETLAAKRAAEAS
jgi:benzoyl-CoA reductase/2-hydroxyglutaryl-CoA dehydratase subunit BcrC/BadD/HgdB